MRHDECRWATSGIFFRSRLAGMAAAALLHLALVVIWQTALKIDMPVQAEPSTVQWVRLPDRLPAPERNDTAWVEPLSTPIGHAPATSRAAPPERANRRSPVEPAAGPAAPEDGEDTITSPLPADAARTPGSAREMLDQARRDAGEIDRALRKESKPYILAPLDSPHIRMAKKFREAAALAPNRLWEAPKVVELVNDGGDGARRTRVLTAAGIYCITERSPATSIDMIERHGKQRITNCGHEHEQPANPQEWRTGRD